jgi:hypothetical protein
MEYSVHNLSEVTDCDSLLAWTQNEKGDLEFKELSDNRLITKYSTTSIDIDATLQGVNAELAATITIIAALPDGPTKTDAENRKYRLEYQKFLLENRKANYGYVALLQKEADLKRIQREITEVNVFITAVTDKKAELMAAA